MEDQNETQELRFSFKKLFLKLGVATLVIFGYLSFAALGVVPKFSTTEAFTMFVVTIYGAAYGIDQATFAQAKKIAKGGE